MNKRLLQFLSAENISQSLFADTIGVARASVSHILSGRNKPGFDFIESMANHYPTLNLEWLITGKGKMYKAQYQKVEQLQPPVPTATDDILPLEEMQAAATTLPEATTLGIPHEDADNKRHISKVIVFYDDNSFQELK